MTRTRTTKWLAILGLVLALALPAVLTACGSDEPASDQAATAAPEPTATATPVPTATPEPAATATIATAIPIVVVSVATATYTPATPNPVEIRPNDLEALVALYHATDGPNWKDNENWLSDAPIDQWSDVLTDDDGRVTLLILYSNELSGEIPPELGSLTNLRELLLGGN